MNISQVDKFNYFIINCFITIIIKSFYRKIQKNYQVILKKKNKNIMNKNLT